MSCMVDVAFCCLNNIHAFENKSLFPCNTLNSHPLKSRSHPLKSQPSLSLSPSLSFNLCQPKLGLEMVKYGKANQKKTCVPKTKDSFSKSKKMPTDKVAENIALQLTSLPTDDEFHTTRRLTNFILHNSDGVPQPVEMLEVIDIFISGIILPDSDECFGNDKPKGVSCTCFGRIEKWNLSGFEDASPVILISTKSAEYECLTPNNSYKKLYEYFFLKACASVSVYKILSKPSGEDPDTSLDELLRSMVGSKYFSSEAEILYFMAFQGEFIHKQLASLDETAKEHETRFAENPVLVALRDERRNLDKVMQMESKLSNGTDRVSEVAESEASTSTDQLVDGTDVDRRYAKLLQDEEYRKILQRDRNPRVVEIRRCSSLTCLASKTIQRRQKKCKMEKKKKKMNGMRATTTRPVNRIWGGYCFPESPNNEEENVEGTVREPVEVQKSHTPKKIHGSWDGEMQISWDGEIIGKTSAGEPLYRQALVGGDILAVGGAVILETPAIYFVEYMFENLDHCKMLHGRLLQRGSETVLGQAANERELFLTNVCKDVQLKELKGAISFKFKSRRWGHQHRKEAITEDSLDRARAEERKAKDLPIEYFCKSLYSPERGGFFSLPLNDIGHGSGICSSCKTSKDEEERSKTKLNVSKTGFFFNGIEYSVDDYVYVIPKFIIKAEPKMGSGSSPVTERKIGLSAFVVCQLMEIIPEGSKKADVGSFKVKVRRFYRPEDISNEKAYASDIQELYYSQKKYDLLPKALVGKCEVRKKNDMPLRRQYPISDHIFFCELFYDSSKESLKQLPANMKLKFSTVKDNTLLRKNKGKEVESDIDSGIVKPNELPKEMCLATLDIFAGCGGMSHGLKMAGVTDTKWAIEYEEPAGEAFRQNHPESTVIVDDCNVILRAIMEKCGDEDECISTKEANELAAKLDEDLKSTLPLPGQVDFIIGGPPCQGFSGLNRFKENYPSKVQREMTLAFLSFADYFRPKYFLLENVRAFVSFNKGKTFQLTVASLLEMGYQVRFGILEAGAYGVSQYRKRAFIWAASPEEVLPEWPEPMHVFASPVLNISLSPKLSYAAVNSTKLGAPFRTITVRDTIGDLPPVENGESETKKEYHSDPVSWFQKEIRGDMTTLTDHICKRMNEIQLNICKKIPKTPGANWRDLPKEKQDLIPTSQAKAAKRNNQWKGLFGRLDWQGLFPTSITDPRPTSKVGMCFHPDNDRIVTVRECARSQGFPDKYEFAGNIMHKHKQIGNAVPPPLAFALGSKLKEALLLKN